MIVAGTGHRPNKLGGYSGNAMIPVIELAASWLRARPSEVEYVISGMALGWDQALARAAAMLGIPYVAALPFRDMHIMWPVEAQDHYHGILENAREVVIVNEGAYAPWKMQKRNEWMVDHSDRVLALWNGTPGGTANCIAYAEKVSKPVENLWDQFVKDKDETH